VATGVAAARLDLVNRALDQFADLENLLQLATILCRQVAEDLSLASGIGNRQGTTLLACKPIQSPRKANSVAMHFYGTRVLFGSPAQNAGGANFYSNRAAPGVRRVKKV
jgi:hypothetical protein